MNKRVSILRRSDARAENSILNDDSEIDWMSSTRRDTDWWKHLGNESGSRFFPPNTKHTKIDNTVVMEESYISLKLQEVYEFSDDENFSIESLSDISRTSSKFVKPKGLFKSNAKKPILSEVPVLPSSSNELPSRNQQNNDINYDESDYLSDVSINKSSSLNNNSSLGFGKPKGLFKSNASTKRVNFDALLQTSKDANSSDYLEDFDPNTVKKKNSLFKSNTKNDTKVFAGAVSFTESNKSQKFLEEMENSQNVSNISNSSISKIPAAKNLNSPEVKVYDNLDVSKSSYSRQLSKTTPEYKNEMNSLNTVDNTTINSNITLPNRTLGSIGKQKKMLFKSSRAQRKSKLFAGAVSEAESTVAFSSDEEMDLEPSKNHSGKDVHRSFTSNHFIEDQLLTSEIVNDGDLPINRSPSLDKEVIQNIDTLNLPENKPQYFEKRSSNTKSITSNTQNDTKMFGGAVSFTESNKSQIILDEMEKSRNQSNISNSKIAKSQNLSNISNSKIAKTPAEKNSAEVKVNDNLDVNKSSHSHQLSKINPEYKNEMNSSNTVDNTTINSNVTLQNRTLMGSIGKQKKTLFKSSRAQRKSKLFAGAISEAESTVSFSSDEEMDMEPSKSNSAKGVDGSFTNNHFIEDELTSERVNDGDIPTNRSISPDKEVLHNIDNINLPENKRQFFEKRLSNDPNVVAGAFSFTESNKSRKCLEQIEESQNQSNVSNSKISKIAAAKNLNSPEVKEYDNLDVNKSSHSHQLSKINPEYKNEMNSSNTVDNTTINSNVTLQNRTLMGSIGKQKKTLFKSSRGQRKSKLFAGAISEAESTVSFSSDQEMDMEPSKSNSAKDVDGSFTNNHFIEDQLTSERVNDGDIPTNRSISPDKEVLHNIDNINQPENKRQFFEKRLSNDPNVVAGAFSFTESNKSQKCLEQIEESQNQSNVSNSKISKIAAAKNLNSPEVKVYDNLDVNKSSHSHQLSKINPEYKNEMNSSNTVDNTTINSNVTLQNRTLMGSIGKQKKTLFKSSRGQRKSKLFAGAISEAESTVSFSSDEEMDMEPSRSNPAKDVDGSFTNNHFIEDQLTSEIVNDGDLPTNRSKSLEKEALQNIDIINQPENKTQYFQNNASQENSSCVMLNVSKIVETSAPGNSTRVSGDRTSSHFQSEITNKIQNFVNFDKTAKVTNNDEGNTPCIDGNVVNSDVNTIYLTNENNELPTRNQKNNDINYDECDYLSDVSINKSSTLNNNSSLSFKKPKGLFKSNTSIKSVNFDALLQTSKDANSSDYLEDFDPNSVQKKNPLFKSNTKNDTKLFAGAVSFTESNKSQKCLEEIEESQNQSNVSNSKISQIAAAKNLNSPEVNVYDNLDINKSSHFHQLSKINPEYKNEINISNTVDNTTINNNITLQNRTLVGSSSKQKKTLFKSSRANSISKVFAGAISEAESTTSFSSDEEMDEEPSKSNSAKDGSFITNNHFIEDQLLTSEIVNDGDLPTNGLQSLEKEVLQNIDTINHPENKTHSFQNNASQENSKSCVMFNVSKIVDTLAPGNSTQVSGDRTSSHFQSEITNKILNSVNFDKTDKVSNNDEENIDGSVANTAVNTIHSKNVNVEQFTDSEDEIALNLSDNDMDTSYDPQSINIERLSNNKSITSSRIDKSDIQREKNTFQQSSNSSLPVQSFQNNASQENSKSYAMFNVSKLIETSAPGNSTQFSGNESSSHFQSDISNKIQNSVNFDKMTSNVEENTTYIDESVANSAVNTIHSNNEHIEQFTNSDHEIASNHSDNDMDTSYDPQSINIERTNVESNRNRQPLQIYSTFKSIKPKNINLDAKTKEKMITHAIEKVSKEIENIRKEAELEVAKMLDISLPLPLPVLMIDAKSILMNYNKTSDQIIETKHSKKLTQIGKASVNKSYKINKKIRVDKNRKVSVGRVAKRNEHKKIKLYMKELWITKRLYNFVQNKLKKKYGIMYGKKSEIFMKYLSSVVNKVEKSEGTDTHNRIEELKVHMANMNIITTHRDFMTFVDAYLPHTFRIKSIPAPGRDVPKVKGKLDDPIIKRKKNKH